MEDEIEMEDEIDLQLQQLAVEAKQHPAQSRQRNRALTKLIEIVRCCHRLARPYKAGLQGLIYQDLYNEALVKTIEYICLKIDNYYPEKPVMAWVNHILKYRFSDVVDRHMNENRRRELPSLNDLDDKLENWLSEELQESEEARMMRELHQEWCELRKLIEEDPDSHFRRVSLRGRPDITWQVIALAKLDGETLDSISQRFGVALTTIADFYKRNLRRFGDYIRNRLQ
ncbi:hypothetical protein QUB70_07445 [Microcoleus sp. A003_D6]|uniref:hypothetical protein n=1 Tax=Microcoleus sp. A003_D6 TaxID=3055266 RepID=UPI002FD121A5